MFNRVIVCGRLTRDLQIQKTNEDIPYVRFSVAVTNFGQKSNNTIFIDCLAWRNNAVNMCNYLKKGSLILIEGRLQRDPSGRLNINTNTVTFMESKKQRESYENQKSTTKVVEIDETNQKEDSKEDSKEDQSHEEAIDWNAKE